MIFLYFCSLARSDTIVQVLPRYNLLLQVYHLKIIVENTRPMHSIFYEEKVVFDRSLWYIASFGPSKDGRLKACTQISFSGITPDF